MKTRILSLFIFSSVLLLNECYNDGANQVKEISFEDFSLSENCAWTNFDFDNKVIVINSKSELEEYVKGDFQEIDFNKYSLIVASGEIAGGIFNITKQIIRVSDYEYELNLDIESDLTAIAGQKWTVSILTPKLSDKINIKVNVNLHREYESLYRENIIGKWKLIEITTTYNYDYQNREIINYSKENIIYDFQTDNKLIITGIIPNDLSEGEHAYEYKKPNVDPLALPGPNLSIDDFHFYCEALVQKDTIGIGGDATQSSDYISWSKKMVKCK
jgi:hypothetical protein